MDRESDHILKIYTEKETIETTLTHPFYVNGQWVDASELKAGDKLYMQDNKEIKVYNTEYVYESTNVYNFEVENLHNYFVGTFMFLVHIAKRCLSDLAKSGEKYAQNLLKGIKFNKIMSKKMGSNYVHEVWTKGMKSRVDSFLKGGGEIISRKATQLSDIGVDTAKKYINEIGTKYSGKVIQNAERAGSKVMKGDKILQIPKQNNPIPKEIIDYADKAKVTIQEVKDVTMDMLKNW